MGCLAVLHLSTLSRAGVFLSTFLTLEACFIYLSIYCTPQTCLAIHVYSAYHQARMMILSLCFTVPHWYKIVCQMKNTSCLLFFSFLKIKSHSHDSFTGLQLQSMAHEQPRQ